MIVTARLHFSASHRLHNPDHDAEWNRRTYDKDNNPKGHGHNYYLNVSVQGPINRDTGMVIDLKKLKDIIQERVIEHVDHAYLNDDVEFLRGIVPTAENMVRCFWQQLAPAIDEGRLCEIVLEETEKNSVTYRGEDEK